MRDGGKEKKKKMSFFLWIHGRLLKHVKTAVFDAYPPTMSGIGAGFELCCDLKWSTDMKEGHMITALGFVQLQRALEFGPSGLGLESTRARCTKQR